MRNLVLIAGRPSHPPGQHEFRAGTRLLQGWLAGVPGLSVNAYDGGWVPDHGVIEKAHAVVIFADGGRGHPLLEDDRMGEVGSLVRRGGGVGLMHYATELPVDAGAAEVDAWVGGHYEDRFSCNPIWNARFDGFPEHPITRGVEPFETTDEWYINLRFAAFSTSRYRTRDETRFWPILAAAPTDNVRAGPYVWPHGPYPHVVAAAGRMEVVMWAVERPDGGRGFGLTGGHFHENWGNPQFRKVVLTALVWVTGVDVPAQGISSDLGVDDLRRDLDEKSTSRSDPGEDRTHASERQANSGPLWPWHGGWLMNEPIGIGILGAGWISRVHGHALHTIGHIAPLARPIRLAALSSRRAEQGEALANELGVDRFTTDWAEVVNDPNVHVVANLQGSLAHSEATEAALALGKPVLCEKPLGADRLEAGHMAAAAARAGVPAVCGFNARYMPAMRLAREIVQRGELGDVVHFRAVYLQDHAAVRPAVRQRNTSRAVTDYAHIVDFLRYLGCDAEAVQASSAKLTDQGPDVEDAYVAAIDLRGGGLASLEASRVASGWKARQRVEFNGTDGSLWWDMEDLNRLHVFYAADEKRGTGGFRDILVTQPDHPFSELWWPPGHPIGWEHSFVHQWRDFLSAIIDERPISAEQATFEDGYEAAVLCDAIITSAQEGRRVFLEEMRTPTATTA